MTSPSFWLWVIALAVLLMLIAVVRLLATSIRDWDWRQIFATPMAPQQKRAWFSLAIGIVMTAAIVGVFFYTGVTSFHENQQVRLLVTGLFLGGLAAYMLMVYLTRASAGTSEIVLDERDKLALSHAPAVQAPAVLIVLAIWCIALTELYWEQGAIPVVYPYLVFFSCLIVQLLAYSVGTLIGYAKTGGDHAES